MVCHFLPKFHPEMNPIEYFWAWIKRYFREQSNGQWKKAQELTAEALAACPLPTIRRFFRRADRYASVYHDGVTGPVAEFAVKQYRSHRVVKKTEIEVAEANWKKKYQLGSRV
jgi:transposase